MTTNAERVLDYLWSVSPNGATNAEIRAATDIHSHQQVYMLTQELLRRGMSTSRREGKEWIFFGFEGVWDIAALPLFMLVMGA